MKFKKILGIVTAATIASQVFAADVTLKLGHLANEQNSWHLFSVKFADLVAAKTKGAVEVKVFPNDQLGKEIDLINAMQLGQPYLTITGESMQNWAPKAALLGVPYLIQSENQLKAVADGAIGKEITKEIEEKVKVKPLTYLVRGPRNLTSNRPISSPDDLKGLVMRVPNVPMYIKVWEGLGAKPTPMAFGEVFTAMQSNVIEAQENPLALIRSASFNEVQKYVNQTEHVFGWIYLAIGMNTWDKLKPEHQKALMEAASEAQAYERDLFHKNETGDEAYLKGKGMTFNPVDKKAFSAKADTVLQGYLKPELLEIYKKIKNMK